MMLQDNKVTPDDSKSRLVVADHAKKTSEDSAERTVASHVDVTANYRLASDAPFMELTSFTLQPSYTELSFEKQLEFFKEKYPVPQLFNQELLPYLF